MWWCTETKLQKHVTVQKKKEKKSVNLNWETNCNSLKSQLDGARAILAANSSDCIVVTCQIQPYH